MAETNVPDWLTNDFLKSCLQTDDKNHQKITVTSHTVESAVPPGNNYGSHMLRVKIYYKKLSDEHTLSLIIKAPLTGGIMEEFKAFLEVIYKREPNFYNQFISETYKLCKHDIVPKHYLSPNPLCVVLEDLKTSGYVMADRHKLLDFDHCELYVKASAKLHALSVAVNKKHPEMIQSLVKDSPMLADKLQHMIKGMLYGGLQCMAAFLEDKADYKEYFDIIKEASEGDTLWNIYQEMEKSEKPLKALTQGDPWCTNMMFKYDNSGKVIRVKLFDYQSLKFTTPVIEFITFVWVSAQPEVRKTKLNDLYHLYCDSLNGSLAELGCSERLSFEELKADITTLSPHVVMVVCMMGPICIADGVADINDYITGNISNIPIKESPIYTLYQGTTFNKYYPQILDQVAEEGIFDYLKEELRKYKQER